MLGLAVATVAFSTRDAAAQELRYHLDASAARTVGGVQQSEFGYGASGEIAVELELAHMVGAQVEAGALWLSHGRGSANPSIQSKSDGDVLGVMGGVRFHPTFAGGLWIDANVGAVETGPVARPAMDAHIGFDVHVGGHGPRWDVGPFLGYEQIFEPSNTAFPDDAHIVMLGAHIAVGPPRPRSARPRGVEARIPTPAPASPQPSIALAPPQVPAPLVRTDIDGDGVLDMRDACPTIPGVTTYDPETNGCPLPSNGVSVRRDELVLFDRIYFDTDRARIKHVSWPIVGALADFIKAHPELERVSIEGHADERGDDAYNEELSHARAEAVRTMLVHRFQVDETVVVLKAWGESQPADPRHSRQAHEKNRRVEFIVTRVGPPSPSEEPSPSAVSQGEP